MKEVEDDLFSDILKHFRMRAGLSQQELANRAGIHRNTLSGWEQGNYLPRSRPSLQALADVLELNQADTLKLLNASFFPVNAGQDLPNKASHDEYDRRWWYVPHYRNPFFTGRDAILQQIHHAFFTPPASVVSHPLALSGLGGIGKTQTALGYAYHFSAEYQAVFSISAETHETLTTECLQLATLLDFSERERQCVVASIKRWLQEHSRWLLIVDNVEDLSLLHAIVPTTHTGHVLLTTREQTTGLFAHRINLEKMTNEESILLLLRRSKLLSLEKSLQDAPSSLYAEAKKLGVLLDGLPLALDQAGAYIESSGCSLSDYLERYQSSRALLLQQRGTSYSLHPASVTTTFTLCFEQLAPRHPLAANILQLCAFLHPDAIPIEFLMHTEEHIKEPLPDTLQPITFDAAIAALRHISLLLHHSQTRTLSIHRLVQVVLKERMDEQTQHYWAERAVQIVSAAFPDVERLTTWPQCQRYLPHALACIESIEQWHIRSHAAQRLLIQTSAYLREQAQEARANVLADSAHMLGELSLGSVFPDLATDFFSFMRHAYYQGTYHAASALIQEKITHIEHTLGSDHPDLLYLHIGQAFFYHMLGKYTQAEELYQRALTIQNVTLLYQRLALSQEEEGAGLPHVGFVLSMLGQLYTAQGKYQQATELFELSLAIWDQYATLTHLFKGPYLHGFALLLLIEKRYDMARDLLQQEQKLLEDILGEDHPIRADNDNAQAQLALLEGNYSIAERCLRQAKGRFKRTTGLDHPFAVRTFHLWAQLHLAQGSLKQAKGCCLQAVRISETVQGLDHPETAQCLKTLADIFCLLSGWIEAEPLYRRVLSIDEETLGMLHPHYISTLEAIECCSRVLST